MTEDVNNVQPAEVSNTETPAPEAKPVVKEEPQTQPLTPETVKELIAKELAEAKEAAKREIQSAKDRARAEVEAAYRKATVAESTLNTVRGRIKETDPDFEKEVRLAELEAQTRQYSQKEQEEAARRQAEQFESAFRTGLTQFITENDVDPKDTRIDWGDDAKDYLEKQQRVLKSVTKIRKEESKKAEEKRSQEVKDIEARLRKELGLDTVDTSMPSASPGTFGEIEAKYSRGEISTAEYTKERKKAGLS